MTRIIAGFAGSLQLAVPGRGTRPTSDRVREAIFSGLEARDALRRARVLDLYAGSGALGLESASRGAASVTLVERAAAAAALCRKNAHLVTAAAGREGEAPSIRVAAQAVQSFVTQSTGPWDLVFLDPPYEVGEEELTEALTALVPQLAEEATVIVERSSRSPEPRWPAGLEPVRLKSYGDTAVWTAEPSPVTDAPADDLAGTTPNAS